jgi:glutaconate CoA-transferase subunit A
VHAPFGAHPCCCDSRYGYDQDELRRYYAASGSAADFDKYLQEMVFGVKDHWGYLDRIGVYGLITNSTVTSAPSERE